MGRGRKIREGVLFDESALTPLSVAELNMARKDCS